MASPALPTDSAQSVAPYLSAAHTILSTLEKEVRAAAAPGSAYEVAANALAVRCTELRSQLTRLEFEKRNEALLEQLDGNHIGRSQVSGNSRLRPLQRDPAAVKQIATLTGKLAQAEADCKAYKSRLRQQDKDLGRVRELTAREADLERRLLAAEASQAAHSREMEELRRRAVHAEASCDALREEMEHSVSASSSGHQKESELLGRISELERSVQSLSLQRASAERKAEICEAELVDTLAKVYTLEEERDQGYASSYGGAGRGSGGGGDAGGGSGGGGGGGGGGSGGGGGVVGVIGRDALRELLGDTRKAAVRRHAKQLASISFFAPLGMPQLLALSHRAVELETRPFGKVDVPGRVTAATSTDAAAALGSSGGSGSSSGGSGGSSDGGGAAAVVVPTSDPQSDPNEAISTSRSSSGSGSASASASSPAFMIVLRGSAVVTYTPAAAAAAAEGGGEGGTDGTGAASAAAALSTDSIAAGGCGVPIHRLRRNDHFGAVEVLRTVIDPQLQLVAGEEGCTMLSWTSDECAPKPPPASNPVSVVVVVVVPRGASAHLR